MKSVIFVALVVVAVAVAAPTEPTKIVRSEFDQSPEGGYNLYFETDDGTIRQEKGLVKQVLDEDKKSRDVIVVSGSYSYINDQGKQELINYQADEEGFKAQGDSIPKAPVVRR
ncbi:unnamed protein product [Arctia plantaginis]|uniref:Uncharacterized protein n=1 Tax=Arctia plantaginis TaxID=874455 RepID=A0A8S0YPL2_ARCPL|nr:unnamed protein product [Arctia plantaginis]CAB3243583.1 unnamed protein product [Arctia plantaginis]